MYKKGGVIVLQIELTPTFGVICDIIVFDVNNYYIVCEKLVTDHFDTHFHAYQVAHCQRKSYNFCKPSDFADHNVLGIYKSSDNLFVTLKYYIVEKV